MKQSNFQILGQRITKSVFSINKQFDTSKEKDFEIQINSNITINKNEIEKKAIVILEVDIFEENSTKYPFYLKLENEGLFSWDDSITNLDDFLNYNAPAVLLSNIRSIASQLTSFAGFPPLIIPLINFQN